MLFVVSQVFPTLALYITHDRYIGSWVQCYDFENIFDKQFDENAYFYEKILLVYANGSYPWISRITPNFSPKIGENRRGQ
jgi:hypothetical protein